MSRQQRQTNSFSWRAILRRLLPRLLVNALLPFILYRVAKQVYPSSALFPLLVAAFPPLLLTLGNFIRKRRFDLLGTGVLAGLLVGIALSLIGADPRWLLLRESFVTGLLGIVCLISLFFTRPLVYWAFKYLVTGGTLSQALFSDAILQQQTVRSAFKLTTFVLGMALILEVCVRVYLVFALNIETSLIVLPVLLHSLQLIVALWCFFILRAAMRRGRHALPQAVTMPPVKEESYS